MGDQKYTLYSFYLKELKIPKKYKSKEEHEDNVYRNETTIFTAQKKRLVFVAGIHAQGINNYTKFLEKLLKKERPEILLVEDRKDTDPNSRLVNILKRDGKGWTEVDWLYTWGVENKIPVRGMDIKRSEELNPYLDAFGETEGMKISILMMVMLSFRNPYLADPNKLSNEEYYNIAVKNTAQGFSQDGYLNAYKDDFLKLKNRPTYKSLGSEAFIRKIVDDMVKKYIKSGKAADTLSERAVHAPYPFEKKYKINKIWTLWNAARDMAMIEECIKSLKLCNRVVAVAGSGHIQSFRWYLARAIKEDFGAVKFSMLEDAGKNGL